MRGAHTTYMVSARLNPH